MASVSAADFKCRPVPGGSSASYIALTNRHTRRETRYHDAPHLRCLEAAAAEAERRAPDEVILRFAHPRSCSRWAGCLAGR
jgi:hypothetical protein